MLISPDELKYFIEITNTLNFSRAAERLGISQPTLSLSIKHVEGIINEKLFRRHKHGVSLTQAGKQLLAHSKMLLQYWDQVKSKAIASHRDTQGSFVIGCHPTLALHCLSGFLPSLLEQYPKLEISFEHDVSRKITEQVISLAIDIGIVVNPIRHPDLIIRKLCDDEMTLWRANVKSKIQQFNSDIATIICDPQLTQTQVLLKTCKKMGLSYARIMPTSSFEVIASLTAKGCGIGILPRRVVASSYLDVLSKVQNAPVYHDEICMLYRVENRNIKAMQVITNAIKEFFI